MLDLFSKGELNGTMHTCVGQEMVPALLASRLTPADYILSNRRGHGHFLSVCGNIADGLKISPARPSLNITPSVALFDHVIQTPQTPSLSSSAREADRRYSHRPNRGYANLRPC